MGEVTPLKQPVPQPISGPAPITDAHDLAAFDCGVADLNAWLKTRALDSDGKSARTYVIEASGRVIAYYCLAAGAVIRGELPSSKIRRDMPESIPVVVVGRGAVDLGYQKSGLGSGMLRDAIKRALQSSRTIGVRAIVIHAKDDNGVAFYRKLGFLPSPMHPRTLVMPIETAAAALP